MRHVEAVGARVHGDQRALPEAASQLGDHALRAKGDVVRALLGLGEVPVQRLQLGQMLAPPASASRCAAVSRASSSATSAASASRASATIAADTGSAGRFEAARRRSGGTSVGRHRAAPGSRSTCRSGDRREPTTRTVSAVETTSFATACPQLPKTPRARGCISAMALFPVAVVATGMTGDRPDRQGRPAARGVHAVAGDDHRAPRAEQRVGDLRDVDRRPAESPRARGSAGREQRGGPPVLTVPASDRLAKTTATGPGAASRRVLDGELERLDGLLRLGDRRGVLGRRWPRDCEGRGCRTRRSPTGRARGA